MRSSTSRTSTVGLRASLDSSRSWEHRLKKSPIEQQLRSRRAFSNQSWFRLFSPQWHPLRLVFRLCPLAISRAHGDLTLILLCQVHPCPISCFIQLASLHQKRYSRGSSHLCSDLPTSSAQEYFGQDLHRLIHMLRLSETSPNI